MNYTRRCKEVIRSIKKAGVQALLVSNPVNVFYLTGFKSSNVF
ncbi:MAG: aminopeptidase P family N-terminal domain-containing protein, partial [Candidatus Heimdallarchaeota archaeon]|nr:aminopeptidase P family N-terminal domain-containing protein [Candidatus Heimdallarchaeota archaeon]